MRALLYQDGRAQYVKNYPKPQPADNESLIKIELAGVCNTDKELLKSYKPDFSGVMGHEFVGVVEASADQKIVGKRVVGELNAGCGHCLYCQSGREAHCLERKVPGLVGQDGCFAEYFCLRNDLLHLVPDGIKPERAVYCEPLAAALEIPERVHIPVSQPLAVIGDGRLAFMIAQVLSLNGTPVTVFGRHAEKLEMFASFASTRLAPTGTFECVVEASGSPSGLASALKVLRSRGSLVLKSTYATRATLDMSEFVVREISLYGSRCGPFVPALSLLGREHFILPDIKLYDLENYEAAFSAKNFKSGFGFL